MRGLRPWLSKAVDWIRLVAFAILVVVALYGSLGFVASLFAL